MIHPHLLKKKKIMRGLAHTMKKIKGTLRVAKKLHKQDKSVANLLEQRKDVVYDAQDLMDNDFKYKGLQQKMQEINRFEAEVSTNQSACKRPCLSHSGVQKLELLLCLPSPLLFSHQFTNKNVILQFNCHLEDDDDDEIINKVRNITAQLIKPHLF